MKDVENRNCHFISCTTYFDGQYYKQFISTSSGILAKEKRGKLPKTARSRLWEVFIPNGYQKTLAEMTEEERKERNNKNQSSLKQFILWYKENIQEKDKFYVKK